MTSVNIHIQPCGYRPQSDICGEYGVCVRSHKVNLNNHFIGTIVKILTINYIKKGVYDSQRYPLNLYLILIL